MQYLEEGRVGCLEGDVLVGVEGGEEGRVAHLHLAHLRELHPLHQLRLGLTARTRRNLEDTMGLKMTINYKQPKRPNLPVPGPL